MVLHYLSTSSTHTHTHTHTITSRFVICFQTAAADFQSIFSGKPHYASSFPFAGPVLSQEQSSQLSNSKWLPSINFTPSSSFDMVSRSHGTMSPILTTANSNYHNGVDFTTNSISRAGQSNNLYNVFPQHTGLKSNEVAGTVMLGNAGCVGYPVCPVSSSLSGWSNWNKGCATYSDVDVPTIWWAEFKQSIQHDWWLLLTD